MPEFPGLVPEFPGLLPSRATDTGTGRSLPSPGGEPLFPGVLPSVSAAGVATGAGTLPLKPDGDPAFPVELPPAIDGGPGGFPLSPGGDPLFPMELPPAMDGEPGELALRPGGDPAFPTPFECVVTAGVTAGVTTVGVVTVTCPKPLPFGEKPAQAGGPPPTLAPRPGGPPGGGSAKAGVAPAKARMAQACRKAPALRRGASRPWLLQCPTSVPRVRWKANCFPSGTKGRRPATRPAPYKITETPKSLTGVLP